MASTSSDPKTMVLRHLEKTMRSQPAGTRLPGNLEVARALGVGVHSVQWAYARLAETGAVTRLRKRGTVVGPPLPAGDLPAPRPGLEESLLAALREGDLPWGEALPPYKVLLDRFAVSRTTLRRALARLEAQGILVRHGRTYRAGAAPAPVPEACFLTLGNNPFEGPHSYRSEFVAPFYQAFYGELQRHGVQLLNGALAFDGPGLPVKAIAALRAKVASKGNRLLGALVFANPYQHPEFFPILQRLGLDHVVFRGPEPALPLGSRRAFQVRCREEDLVECLAEGILSLGHRRCAFLADHVEPWMAERFAGLRAALKRRDPGADLVLLGPDLSRPASWREIGKASDWEAAFRRKSRWPRFLREIVAPQSRWEDLGWWQALLAHLARQAASLVRHPEVTALVFPNDAAANVFEPLWQAAGIRTPATYSLFSADNYPRYFANLAATVDRGLGRMGHALAHHFLRDLPPTLHPGEVLARPFFVPRAGAGAPRRGPPRLPEGLEALAGD